MSDARAIEAVTETLVQLVKEGADDVLSGTNVEAKPPHEGPGAGGDPQLNLFLYQAEVDGSLRNEDPLDLRPGETGDPPLPLVLHYLLTAFVPGGNDVVAHRILGGAIRTLHEHSVLSRERLRDVPSPSNVSEQLDRIRITWQPFEEKDIYSLWSAFQTPYRLSVAFEVRAVLIDSRRPPRTPVPVLKRGKEDLGPAASADPRSPFPELSAAVPVAVSVDEHGIEHEHEQTSAPLGGRVILRGANLGKASQVRLVHPLLENPLTIDVQATNVTEDEVRFPLSGPPEGYAAGLWSVSLLLKETVDGDEVSTVTNEVPLAIAPQITSAMPMTVTLAGGTATVDLTCAPPVRAGQQALLLLGSRSIAEARAVQGNPVVGSALRFVVEQAPLGKHLARLRVGGVDSLLVDRTKTKPEFDASQTVTVNKP